METQCYFCKTPYDALTVARSSCCTRCNRDIKCCKNCTFYDPAAYNQCRESQAERVVEKDRANFCDYFRPTITKGGTVTPPGESAAEKAKKALDALFK